MLACEPFEFIDQARFLEAIYTHRRRLPTARWEDLDPAVHGTFDLVHCHGVLYHEPTRWPMLERLHLTVAPGGTMFLGSMMLASAELSEYAPLRPAAAYYGDPTWWWVPGRLCLRWMLETAGFDRSRGLFGESPGPPGEFPIINGYCPRIR